MSAIVRVPWANKPARAPSKRKPAALPEYMLQAAMVAEFNKLEAEGWPLSAVGDMNAARRGYAEAAKCKAMGMKAGEPDVRVYLESGKLVLIEVKVGNGALSPAQVERHGRLRWLGHTVGVARLTTEEQARQYAREVATVHCLVKP